MAFPVKAGEAEPFEEPALDFIAIGESTKADIASAMAQFPQESSEGTADLRLEPLQFRGGDTWLYAQARAESRWFYYYHFLDIGDVGVSATSDYRYLLIEFDQQGVVSDYSVSESEGRGCNDQGVCARGAAVMLLAGSEVDSMAKQFRPRAGTCGVYLYGERVKLAAPIWLSKVPQGWLLDDDHYLYFELDPRNYRLISQIPDEALDEVRLIECRAGTLFFFELEHRGRKSNSDRSTTIYPRQESVAIEEINQRQRLLIPSHIPES